MKTRNLYVPASLAALAAVSLSGCGDDDAGSGETSAFCDAFGDVETAFSGFPWDAPDEWESYIDEAIAPPLDEFESNAPDELSGEVDTIVTSVRTFAETGDFSPIESDEMHTAELVVNDHLFAECPGERLEVTAVDFAFEDLPDEVPAGPTVIRLHNEGQEEHEMLLARRLPGTTEPVEELLALPEEELVAKLELIGGVGAAPAEADVTVTDLAAGDYVVVCFIPTGTTGGVAGDGPPHAFEGMVAEFEVT